MKKDIEHNGAGNNIQLVTYKYTYPNGETEIRKGLLIHSFVSTAGFDCVNIDNYSNSVLLSNVISIKTLSEQW